MNHTNEHEDEITLPLFRVPEEDETLPTFEVALLPLAADE
jgi:hypothetical protein